MWPGQSFQVSVPQNSKPLDVVINKPLKDILSKTWEGFIRESVLAWRTNEVKVREMILEDDTARIKVNLWRDAASSEAKLGQNLTIKDSKVVYSEYNKEVTGTEPNNKRCQSSLLRVLQRSYWDRTLQ